MAGNQYAVDFSPISEGIKTFKKKKYNKRLKGEVDTLVKKREGLDTELAGATRKQRQLMSDTPEMDQTYNQQGLGQLQSERLQARTNKYNELGGLTPEDMQGMSTEAVDLYKTKVATERVASRAREDQMTADALITFEAMGKDPKYLKDWFNETQAHKWGLPDGVARFEQAGDNVLVYENGKDYNKEGNTPTAIPREQFGMFASSALNPESTKLVAKSLKEGNIPIIVKANQLKESMQYYDNLEEARTAMGINNIDWKKMMGVPTAVETLKEYINVVDDEGNVTGMSRGVSRGGKEFQRKGPAKQVVTKAGSGSGANKRVELLLKVREANAKQDKQASEALYREVTSQYGNEDMIAIDKSGNIIPNTKLMKQELDNDIEEYTLLVEQNDEAADKEYLIQLQSWKNAIKEAKARGLRTTDTNDNIMDVVLQYIDASSGGDVTGLKGDRQASPSGMGQPIEARGTSKSRGSTKKTAEGKVVPALEPSVSMPQAMGMQTSPPTVYRPDARAKRTQGKLSPEAKAARIKELNKKLKGLI